MLTLCLCEVRICREQRQKLQRRQILAHFVLSLTLINRNTALSRMVQYIVALIVVNFLPRRKQTFIRRRRLCIQKTMVTVRYVNSVRRKFSMSTLPKTTTILSSQWRLFAICANFRGIQTYLNRPKKRAVAKLSKTMWRRLICPNML